MWAPGTLLFRREDHRDNVGRVPGTYMVLAIEQVAFGTQGATCRVLFLAGDKLIAMTGMQTNLDAWFSVHVRT